MEIARLVTLGIPFDRAEQFNAYDRVVWLIALRIAQGEKFDWGSWRFIEPKVERAS